ncbi:ABC transporter ATP-binding protein [Streptomyces sp. NPDC048518]|uniref:ABC transporter ATP-binding protein n=1 Tax=Streptomyces sp. NPDC048518 TaxID=3155029 RepID=UPI0034052CD7
MAASPTDPGTPDHRGPARYLWWVTVSQPRRVALGALLGSAWMICLTLPPYVLAHAIDDGLRPGDRSVLLTWSAVLFGIGVVNAWLAIMRHRTMTRVRLDAYFRTVRVVIDHATRLGAALPRRLSAGQVVTIGHSDVGVISQTLTVTGPGVGAVLSYVVVAALLFSVSTLLAVVVLVGVPLLAMLVGPFLSRLRVAETDYRERQGALAAILGDLAGGLRVLNGLGGKAVFAARYRDGSRRLRDEGYRVGSSMSWIQAFSLGLPALFLAAVTWLAARMAAQGSITVGELVAVYGYVAVLAVPVTFFIEAGYDIGRGLVAARRVVNFLNLEPESLNGALAEPLAERGSPEQGAAGRGLAGRGLAELGLEEEGLAEGGLAKASAGAAGRRRRSGESPGGAGAGAPPVRGPQVPSVLRGPQSGVEVAPGLLTALATRHATDGTDIVDRLGRFAPPPATWGSVRLDAMALDEVRSRILVADNEADLFAGTLRAAISGRWSPEEDALARAVEDAAARDILLGLPDGLDALLEAHGHNLSAGQRQRIRLARALLADPEILLAVDPTSAVDAHTAAHMAARLRAARQGRTTLVTSTSPLVLDQADTVYYLVDGRVTAVGRHRDLLTERPDYRRLVSPGDENGDETEKPHTPPRHAPSRHSAAEPGHEALR